jgi:hypothetical protein
MSNVNPLNAGPEGEAFIAKAEAFFASDSLSALQIANRLKTDRTTVAKDFSAALGADPSNPNVVQITKVCERYVNALNSTKTKRFAKADLVYSVTTL